MYSRNRLLVALLLGLTAGACASGSSTTNETEPGPANTASERSFPPGTAPSRNVWTRSGQIYLDQAENTNAADERAAEFTAALEQARQSVENEPNNPLGYYQAGVALLGLSRYQEADQMLARAEEIYPRYRLEIAPRREAAWISLFNAGVQALQQGDEARAIEQMTLADQIYQDRPEARTNLALMLTNRGDFDTAIQWYARALETLRGEERQYLTPEVRADWEEQESVIVFNMAQVLQRMDRQAEAIELFREYIAQNPDDAAVKVQLALALSATGQEDEAGAMFSEVLGMQGLAPDEYYQVGIGLFNAGRFDDAVTAFERAVEGNPLFRDAVFNLSQALLAQANALAAQDASPTRLVPLYERLVQIGESLRELDPFSRTAAIVLASSYRSLADLTEGAASTQWRNRLVESLQAIEALPFDITNVALNQVAPGRVELSGTLENLTLAAGTQVGLSISLLGPGGALLDTEEVSIDVPAVEGTASFRTTFDVEGEIAGWRYERTR